MLQIQTIVSQPFEENTYIVWQPPRSDALVIDPGLEPDAILESVLQAFRDEYEEIDVYPAKGTLLEQPADAADVDFGGSRSTW